jgi:hypothetical protein
MRAIQAQASAASRAMTEGNARTALCGSPAQGKPSSSPAARSSGVAVRTLR